jgi:hypothetical protein
MQEEKLNRRKLRERSAQETNAVCVCSDNHFDDESPIIDS